MRQSCSNSAWKIRALNNGANDLETLKTGLVNLKYQVSDLKLNLQRTEISERVRSSYTASTEKKISAHVGQLYIILNEIKSDDFLVIPINKGKSFIIGRVVKIKNITSDGIISIDFSVLREDVSLKEFDQDLRYSFMAIMQICEISRNNAFLRISKVSEGLDDPG